MQNDIPLTIIACMSANRVIGHNGKMPWHLPEDLAFFKTTTLHKPIIMGRATMQSLGKALPNRYNIVVSNSISQCDGFIITASIEQAIAQAKTYHPSEIIIAGGGKIYQQTLPLASKLYLTIIDSELTGDTFFPTFDESQWHITHQRSSHYQHWQYTFYTYQRIMP